MKCRSCRFLYNPAFLQMKISNIWSWSNLVDLSESLNFFVSLILVFLVSFSYLWILLNCISFIWRWTYVRTGHNFIAVPLSVLFYFLGSFFSLFWVSEANNWMPGLNFCSGPLWGFVVGFMLFNVKGMDSNGKTEALKARRSLVQGYVS